MSALLAAPLCLAGCPSDDGETETGANDSTTTDDPGTTVEPPGTTTDAPGTTDGADSSTGDDPGICEDQPIPESPFDCSAATEVLTTSVIIDDSEASDDPAILEGVRRVEGSIQISRTALTDLDFMGCVEEVTGEVTIFDNDSLTNVDGLWSLREIGTDFVFSQNDALVVFDGLPNIQKLIVNLIFKENGALEEITGFQSLVGIEGDINEEGEQFGGNLTIQQNPVLRHIDGLVGLLVLNGTLAITNNPELCMSRVACVGTGIVQPAVPPPEWTTAANNDGC